MKISILNENTAGKRGFLAEHGLSLLIEHEGERWLFDTGQTDVFMKNAALLHEPLTDLSGIILSHGHFDHCGGLEFLVREYQRSGKELPPVYVRESAFLDKTAINADRRTYRIIGIPWKRELIESAVRLTQSREEIAPGVVVIGDIPYTPGLEKKPDWFFIDNGTEKIPDYMSDEQMLVLETEKGLCLFAGCCHPGILNCLEYVSQSFPGQKIHSVFAGMHLAGASPERIAQTVEELGKRDFDVLIPVHCTGIEAIGRMKTSFGSRCRLVETGMTMEL